VDAEFNWWLLIVGLVLGAGLVWFVVADSRRREHDIDVRERAREALWVASVLDREGRPVGAESVERILTLHRLYLDSPPPDEPSALDVSEAQEFPTSTGSGPTTAPSAPTNDTPNVTLPVEPFTAGDGPTQ
jgi:hypothetical protein